MIVKIKKLYNDVQVPNYAHSGDAGLDLYSRENYILHDREYHSFGMGFAMEFSEKYVALIEDKSSMALKGIICTGGVCDSSYRGEYHIILYNASGKNYKVEKGDKLAQILFLRFDRAEIKEVESLSASRRGKGAFGSTGRK